MDTNDPHVPKLQEARSRLAVMVKAGEITQAEASSVLGKLADSLAGVHRPVRFNPGFAVPYGRN